MIRYNWPSLIILMFFVRSKGTFEFMSNTARRAYEDPSPNRDPYLQTPVDDMESFLWVAIWVALYNKTVEVAKLPLIERQWRRSISSDTTSREGVATEVGNPIHRLRGEKFNKILKDMGEFLGEWYEEAKKVRYEWTKLSLEIEHGIVTGDIPLILHFDYFAYKAALAFLKPLVKLQSKK